MKVLEKISESNFLKYSIIALLLIISYFPTLTAHKTVSPDAQVILPTYDDYHNVAEYFSNLINLSTVDFQPVRDASLFIDYYIYKTFNVQTFILHNLILWLCCIFFIEKIVRFYFSEIKSLNRFLCILLFSIYPLFSISINWSIARKHILSFLFILIATIYFLEYLESSTKKMRAIWVFNIAFFLSTFSQPINLLWPFWALFYCHLRKKLTKRTLLDLTPTFCVFFIGLVINSLYYHKSLIFFSAYGTKTSVAFDMPSKVMAIGHYFFQLFAPYWLSFEYDLGHWTIIVGFILMVFFYYFLWKVRVDNREVLNWSLFGALPLAIVTTKPDVLSDTYLLTPAFSLFMLHIFLIKDLNCKNIFLKYLTVVLMVGWTFSNISSSEIWSDRLKFTQSTFDYRQNCENANMLARNKLEIQHKVDLPEKHFLETHECSSFVGLPPLHRILFLKLQIMIIYYDSELSQETRIKALRNFASQEHFLGPLYLAAFYVKEGLVDKANDTIQKLIKDPYVISAPVVYVDVIDTEVRKFCKIQPSKACSLVVEKFGKSVDVPWI